MIIHLLGKHSKVLLIPTALTWWPDSSMSQKRESRTIQEIRSKLRLTSITETMTLTASSQSNKRIRELS